MVEVEDGEALHKVRSFDASFLACFLCTYRDDDGRVAKARDGVAYAATPTQASATATWVGAVLLLAPAWRARNDDHAPDVWLSTRRAPLVCHRRVKQMYVTHPHRTLPIPPCTHHSTYTNHVAAPQHRGTPGQASTDETLVEHGGQHPCYPVLHLHLDQQR